MMLPISLLAAYVGRPARVTLSGENILQVDAVSPYDSQAGVRVNTDGTIDSRKAINGGAATFTQIDSDTDWIIPNGAANGTYEVRVTAVTGTFDVAAAANDVWIALSANRDWYMTSTVQETKTVDFDFEIRFGSGSRLAVGTYQVRITNTV